MTLDDGNGGFPEPPAGESVRVVRCTHTTCGGETRIRLPRELPAEAVRRVVCDGCGHAYECERAEAVGRGSGASRAWRLVSIPIAAAAVIGALLLIRGL
jgi:hypothetical protein